MTLIVAIAFLLAIATLAWVAAVEGRATTRRLERMRLAEAEEFDSWIAKQRKLTSHIRLKAARDRGGPNAA